MSLRSKIVWLFCGFLVLPLLVLAAFTYSQVSLIVTDVLGGSHVTELTDSLDRLYRTYWLFAIGLALATVLGFSLVLRGLTNDLLQLIRASEKIGEGDLHPWIPPPSSAELGRLNLALGRMVERLRAMVEQVDRSGRLAAVGQLSSYLAHEIRTPLSSTRMNLQRLKRWADDGRIPATCKEPIEISLSEVDRLASTIGGVLALTRSQETPLVPVGLHKAVEHAAEVLRAEMGKRRIELLLELDADADLVLGRPGQIQGVVLNLLLNSLQAQPKGGWIQVSSRLVPSSDVSAGPMLELRVRDGGPGVPVDVRARIFEPFFTTKSDGSGIGLALAAQSVRSSGGQMWLEEPLAEGDGAEFVVLLKLAPVTQEVPQEAPVVIPSWEWQVPVLTPRRARTAELDLALDTIPLLGTGTGEVH